jgi:cytochrome c
VKKILLVCLVLAVAVGFAYAAVKATPKEAVALAEKAAAYMKENGETKAFAEFNKRDGKFTDLSKDLYVFVFDMTGKCLSHGTNVALIGKDLSPLKDSSGKFFIKEMLSLAKTKGKGWVDYQWTNPTSKKIEGKATYVLKVSNDRFIGCGIYK